jgi:RNA binding activity-knot of a chromodomain/Caspase domain
MKTLLSALLMAGIVAGATARGETQWQPGRTYVMVASITAWPASAGLASFTGTRRDADLVEQFKAAGVPSGNIVFLKDSAATQAGMRKTLQALAAKSGPEDTLVFCFAGHGGREVLYCYDYDDKRPDDTVFHMNEIYPILEKSWKGNRLFLIGDCCCSGSLRSVLRQFEKQRPDVRVATLGSATASNLSTGNWTFTEGLIRIFAGDSLVDRDHDGRITITEAERFLHDQMKYKEDQLASLTLSASFEKDFVIRAVAKDRPVHDLPGPYKVGDVLDARDSEGKWYASEIIDGKPSAGSYKIHYCGWDDNWDEWVDSSRLRPIVKPKLNVGQHYEVLWEKKWYPATITKTVEDYFYFVHYEGYQGDDDEWITPERARVPRGTSGKTGPEFAALETGPPATGETVAAQWKTDWYRARITGELNGTYAVRYDDNSPGKLAPGEMIPFAKPAELRVGDRVLACWGEEGQMYPGRVKAIHSDKATVRWEDGSAASEVALSALARIQR